MSDDGSETGASDRREVSAGESDAVAYDAEKHGITRDRAKMLIKRFRKYRARLDAEAAKVKK